MPPVNSGFWGEPTATIDWCEQNYEFSLYIAEFWNTVSNLVMIVMPLRGIYIAWKNNMETTFFMCYFFLMLVGIGSWCFHMTLLYEMQLFDELPMVWGSCVLVYTLDSILRPVKAVNYQLLIGLIIYSVVITWTYLVIKSPIFHEVAYGFVVCITIIMDFNLTRVKLCSFKIFLVGLAMYGLGFVLWNIDNVYCWQLNHLRLKLPLFVQPLTQLHAWWHVFAGYGTYIHIVFCCQGRFNYLKVDNELKFGLCGLYVEKTKSNKQV